MFTTDGSPETNNYFLVQICPELKKKNKIKQNQKKPQNPTKQQSSPPLPPKKTPKIPRNQPREERNNESIFINTQKNPYP